MADMTADNTADVRMDKTTVEIAVMSGRATGPIALIIACVLIKARWLAAAAFATCAPPVNHHCPALLRAV